MAYRELERALAKALKGFSTTRQKLNRIERTYRDRTATLLDDVVKQRRQRETASEVRMAR